MDLVSSPPTGTVSLLNLYVALFAKFWSGHHPIVAGFQGRASQDPLTVKDEISSMLECR